MKKLFVIVLMCVGAGCGSLEKGEPLTGTYHFEGKYNRLASTCVPTGSETTSFNFTVLDNAIDMPLFDATFEGDIGVNSFDVSGPHPSRPDGYVEFYSEDFASGNAVLHTYIKNQPICFSIFLGTFE